MEKENSTAKIKYNVFEGDLIIPKLQEGEVGINLGCGRMYIYGWTNCDKKDYEGSISFETDETFDLDVFPYQIRLGAEIFASGQTIQVKGTTNSNPMAFTLDRIETKYNNITDDLFPSANFA